MSEPEGPSGPRERAHGHLPVLSWCLVALVFVYFLSTFVMRPPRQERLQMAALAEALRIIPESFIEEVDREQLYRGAMQGMVASLADKYSSYLTQKQMEHLSEETQGEYGGIGIVFSARNGQAVVEKVMQDGPAARAGLEVGDVIAKVGGEDIANLAADQVAAMVKGKIGTDVELALLRPSTGEAFARTLTRQKISVPNVEYEMREGKIALLKLATFDQNCADEVRQVLRQLRDGGARGLILDLRGNAGGLVKQATDLCDMFIDEGLILAYRGRGGATGPRVVATPNTELPRDVPIIVLVGHGTASAAEILAGVLQAHGRATVVGTGTVGKGSVNSVLRLPDESGLVLTVSRYELQGGKVIEGAGIKPDVLAGEMPARPEGATAARLRDWYVEERQKAEETQLRTALELMRQKLDEA